MPKIILDAGHGGNDLGDIYKNRAEKDDNLRLTMEVGEILQRDYGYEVAYTRIRDSYLSQLDRVEIANSEGGDLLVSFHRIIGEVPPTPFGLGFYIYDEGGAAEQAARSIGESLEEVSFPGYTITIRRDLPLFRNTDMPAIMVGVGSLNSDEDNEFYDSNLEEIAAAIAKGIVNYFSASENEASQTLPLTVQKVPSKPEKGGDRGKYSHLYQIRVGRFSRYQNAFDQLSGLALKGYPAEIIKESNYYFVHVGNYPDLNTAIWQEQLLRRNGYCTVIISS